MGPMPQYAALVDDHGGSCEESLVRGNDQPSPEGGPCRPPLGAIASHCPCPLGGGGGGRRPGGVGGLHCNLSEFCEMSVQESTVPRRSTGSVDFCGTAPLRF